MHKGRDAYRVVVAGGQVARSVLPTMNEMLQEQIGQTGPVEPQDVMVARHRTQLYSTQ